MAHLRMGEKHCRIVGVRREIRIVLKLLGRAASRRESGGLPDSSGSERAHKPEDQADHAADRNNIREGAHSVFDPLRPHRHLHR